MKKSVGIYGIRNIITGKFYIGMSTNTENRCRDHFYDLNRNKHHSQKLQRSFNKHGERCFIFGIIEECNIDELFDKEAYWINYYNTYKNGYNSSVPNGKNQGRIWQEEEKKKVSVKSKAYQDTIPLYKRREHMKYIKSFIKIHTNKKCYLYDKNTIELKHVFNSMRECASFLKCTESMLSSKLKRLWTINKQSYKGYYIIREGESLEEYLNIINKRKEKNRLIHENKKDKYVYYIKKSDKERKEILKLNAAKASEAKLNKLRLEGNNIIQVYKDDIMIKEYQVMADLVKDMKLNSSKIYLVLNGKKQTYKGFSFRRKI